MNTVPASVKRTRIRRIKPETTETVGEVPAEEQRELLPKEEMAIATPKKELSVQGPFATYQQQLDLLTRTKDGKFVFQGRKNGNIITTDSEGYQYPKKPGAKQFVFNSTPEDLRRQTTRTKFVLGEIVYCIRPMSRVRSVYAARVDGFDHRGVILSILGAVGESKFGRNRTRDDGTVIYPYNYCFKDAQSLQQFLDRLRDDFARSQTDFRHLLEQSRK